jgi:hypothetical protein
MELQHVADLIAAHEATLRQLYLTRAQMGLHTPPHVHTEIARVERELDRLQPGPQPLDVMTAYRLMVAETMRLDAAIGQIRRDLRDLREHIDQRFDSLLAALISRPAPAKAPARRAINGGE